jgi:hypothetical protein
VEQARELSPAMRAIVASAGVVILLGGMKLGSGADGRQRACRVRRRAQYTGCTRGDDYGTRGYAAWHVIR